MARWRFLTFLAVGLALLWETRPAYSLAYLFGFLFFVWHKWQAKATRSIVVKRVQNEIRFFCQDSGTVEIQVQNISAFPFAWVSLFDKIPSNLVTGTRLERKIFVLPPGRGNKLSFQLSPKDRGIYRLGPIEVSAGDFFGISTEQWSIPDFQTVVVYPAIYDLGALTLPSRLPVGHLQALQRIYPDPTRLAGVRPYQLGDPLKTLHWPATARTGQFQVKQFEHTVTANCLIFLNLNQGDYSPSGIFSDSEMAISAAASLVTSLLRSGEACGLVANGVLTEHLPKQESALWQDDQIVNIPPRQGLSQLTRILTVLAGIRMQSKIGFSTMLKGCKRVKPGSILLWIIPGDTREIVTQANSFVKQGHQVQLFIVGDRVLHPRLLHRPKGSSLQVFAVRTLGGKAV